VRYDDALPAVPSGRPHGRALVPGFGPVHGLGVTNGVHGLRVPRYPRRPRRRHGHHRPPADQPLRPDAHPGHGPGRTRAGGGRGRALEIVLGCEDFPAELAERYGYLNRALPAAELGPFVERLARRIASFPAEAIALAKASVAAAERPTVEGLLEEAHCFNQSLA